MFIILRIFKKLMVFFSYYNDLNGFHGEEIMKTKLFNINNKKNIDLNLKENENIKKYKVNLEKEDIERNLPMAYKVKNKKKENKPKINSNSSSLNKRKLIYENSDSKINISTMKSNGVNGVNLYNKNLSQGLLSYNNKQNKSLSVNQNNRKHNKIKDNNFTQNRRSILKFNIGINSLQFNQLNYINKKNERIYNLIYKKKYICTKK